MSPAARAVSESGRRLGPDCDEGVGNSGGVAADTLVAGRGMFAEFAHAAQDRDATSRDRERAEGVQGGIHRIRIRVVGVVEHRDPVEGFGVSAGRL